MLRTLEIHGLRGFAEPAKVELAMPAGEAGSGLTMLVGPNNAGKSTIVEALQFLQRVDAAPAFGDGRRNAAAGGRVAVRYTDDRGETALLGTNPRGGGDILWREAGLDLPKGRVYVVPSRRVLMQSMFQNVETDRASFTSTFNGQARSPHQYSFAGRLVRMHNHRDELDTVLRRIVDPVPQWFLEPATDHSGQFGLRVVAEGGTHPVEGMGEGLLSLLFIADALYDSTAGDIIALDEPELSLHPPLQRRLARVLADYARDRQIVYATHSTAFTDWSAVLNGARVVRVFRGDGTSSVAQLQASTVAELRGLLRDYHNPHVLGTDAREVFFFEDGVILVEGQEDVIGYRAIAEQIGVELRGEFYGWGVGGAAKMGIIARVLRDLGYRRVVGVLDEGHEVLAAQLDAEFPGYTFILSPAADVRTKLTRPALPRVDGLLDEHWQLRPELRLFVESLFSQLNLALTCNNDRPEDPFEEMA